MTQLLQPRWCCFLCISLLFAAALQGCAGAGSVTVNKSAPTMEELPMDIKKLPPAMLPRALNQKAFTFCQPSVNWEIEDEVVSTTRRRAGGYNATIIPRKITLNLEMKTTKWFSEGAWEKLRIHEDGHRRIGEMFYADADKKARAIAGKAIGKRFSGVGMTPESARQAAKRRAGQQIRQECLDAINKPAQQVHDIYDRLTLHGHKEEPLEDVAIKMALEEQRRKGK